MTNEMLAKTVFGEITLGEVFSLFSGRISCIGIGPIESKTAGDYDCWWTEGDILHCSGRDEVYKRKLTFNLTSKVKVYENHLEAVSCGGYSYKVFFFETKTIRFDSFLPGAAA